MAGARGLGADGGHRPNILYLMTDHQKASASSANGHAHLPTPFMDALAARGTSLVECYSTNPICTPSRASVFTGVHPLVHQVTCHQNRAPYNLPQLSELLENHGYYTAAAGHYEHDRGLTRGWHEQINFLEKGLFTKGESLYECLLHVPLIIVPPPDVPWNRGTRVAGLVDHVDLFPTILGIAGAPVPDHAQGHDLVPWLRTGARAPLRDAVFAQVGGYMGSLGTTMPSGMPQAGRHPGLLQGVRTAELSYVRDPDSGDEAYDLRRDPGELVNLIGKGRHPEPARVAELRRRVDQWEAECLELRAKLGVVPGFRGFDQ